MGKWGRGGGGKVEVMRQMKPEKILNTGLVSPGVSYGITEKVREEGFLSLEIYEQGFVAPYIKVVIDHVGDPRAGREGCRLLSEVIGNQGFLP